MLMSPDDTQKGRHRACCHADSTRRALTSTRPGRSSGGFTSRWSSSVSTSRLNGPADLAPAATGGILWAITESDRRLEAPCYRSVASLPILGGRESGVLGVALRSYDRDMRGSFRGWRK